MTDRFKTRRDRLCRIVQREKVDALLVTNEKNVSYLTGFSGDSSYFLIGPEHEIVISDFRYVTQLEEEASVVAAHAAKACPIVSTITLWAQDLANPKTRVFQALISEASASRINVERAKDFADTRYIRLFDDVKNIAKGDVFDVAAAPAAPAAPEATTKQ